jgi:hypothetical protein
VYLETAVRKTAPSADVSKSVDILHTVPPQIFRTDEDMAGYFSLLVPNGTRTGTNGKVLLPDAS